MPTTKLRPKKNPVKKTDGREIGTEDAESLCYQLPAIISKGCAIIVSPLIALMKNQVDLVRGYSSTDHIAHFLNSTLNKGQQKEVKDDLISGSTKMLYVAPETPVSYTHLTLPTIY